ncbi:MAG: hypothetical protein GY934_16035 [Gammaproteobacteria bacterium]|nr:hypothetical protein [Gammaproteobacteria bacterium]
MSCLVTGKHLHRFQAERICHDHVLPTTVSDLQSVYGLVINRKLIRVPGHKGRMATVSNYWLEESELLKAEKLLEKRDGQ